MRRALLVVAIIGLVGCADRQAPAGEHLAISIDSSGSFPVVTARGEPGRWTLESLAVIRPDSVYGFSHLRSIAIDPAGGVWIADSREDVLQHYGDDGRLIESRGRTGAGPGEFRRPFTIAMDSGRLVVWDIDLSRTTRWLANGDLDDSWLWMGGNAASSGTQWYATPSGPKLYMPIYQRDDDGKVVERAVVWLGMNLGGRHDTIMAPRLATTSSDETRTCDGENGSIWFWPTPFLPKVSAAPHDGLVAMTQGSRYEIELLARSGDTLKQLVREVPLRPVSDAEWDSASSEYRSDSDTMSLSHCRGKFRRMASHPAIVAMTSDAQGRLWVESVTDSGTGWEAWRNDSLLGRVAAPPTAPAFHGPIPVFDRDRLAVPVLVEAGGMEVVLYRIVGMR